MIASTLALSPWKLVTFSPNTNNPKLVIGVIVPKLPVNPVALTLTNSPATNVPWVTNPSILLPTTKVTVILAADWDPTTSLPTLGKIPLIFVNVNVDWGIFWIWMFTYLTLAGGCGGSANTIESPWSSKDTSGVWTTPLIIINNWFALATIFSLRIVSGNWVLIPSNKLEISSNLWTTEVRIFSEDVNLFCLNSTSVLLNSE